MGKWELPLTVEIDGKELEIRNKCDYRVVLDVISCLNDNELDDIEKANCCLFIFYENADNITDPQKAINEMIKIINLGVSSEKEENNKPKMMDWEHDFVNIAPPISRVLGYSVRDKNNYTHWYDFIGAYMEIGDCYFAQIMSVRSKKAKGKKLDENDRKFYAEHKEEVDLPQQISQKEQEWLDSDW